MRTKRHHPPRMTAPVHPVERTRVSALVMDAARRALREGERIKVISSTVVKTEYL